MWVRTCRFNAFPIFRPQPYSAVSEACARARAQSLRALRGPYTLRGWGVNEWPSKDALRLGPRIYHGPSSGTNKQNKMSVFVFEGLVYLLLSHSFRLS